MFTAVRPDFTRAEIAWVKRNNSKLTNQQMADRFGIGYRNFCARKSKIGGLQKIKLEYWTQEQINYLLKWYQRRGDLELARMFSKRWYKEKGWTLKHIEKKRLYLKLKRTPEELHAIKERAKKQGVYIRASKKTWATRGIKKEGTIVYWHRRDNEQLRPFIKVNGRFIQWTRWYWQKHRGPIPEGMKVCFTDGNTRNLRLSNLHLAKGSSALSDEMIIGRMTMRHPELRPIIKKEHPHLIQMQRQLIILKRTMYEFQQKSA